MEYVWDETKRDSNFIKHKVDFLYAIGIFESDCIKRIDGRKDYGETRLICMGEISKVILVVVYVERGDTVRIISARKAGRHERRYYGEVLAERNRRDGSAG
jgi:uncharacterized protein